MGKNVTIELWKLIAIILIGASTSAFVCNLYYMYQIAMMSLRGC